MKKKEELQIKKKKKKKKMDILTVKDVNLYRRKSSNSLT